MQIFSVELKVIVRQSFIYSIMKVQLSLLGKTYKNYEVFKHVLLIIKSILYNFDHLIFSIFAYIICNQIKLNENMKLLIMTFITGCLCI